MQPTAYDLKLPQIQATPLVFASPHSGRMYPPAFLRASSLDERTIRSSEDAFVDMLFRSVPDHGAAFLAAHAPRAFVDLNRASEELDAALIDGVRKIAHNPRVTSGLGVIPRVVSNGRAIYRGKISLDEARARIRDYWRPYHDRLQQLLDDVRMMHRHVVLIDCHSMPHEAIDAASSGKGPKPQIVLGDRFGAAANQAIVDQVEAAFVDQGLRVVRNTPFAGAYTAQHYGRPSKGQHVIQVEIDRALYMDEKLIQPSSEFAAFQQIMERVVERLVQIGQEQLPLAAE